MIATDESAPEDPSAQRSRNTLFFWSALALVVVALLVVVAKLLPKPPSS